MRRTKDALEGKNKAVLIHYKCPYCKYEFDRSVRRVESYNEQGQGSALSSQVRCRQCSNFLKTWE